VACALVVLIHINLYTRRAGLDTWWPAGFLSAPIYGIPVPTFFMLSGFFAGRFAQGVRRPSIVQFLNKRLNILIVPFFVWNCILLLLLSRTIPFSPGQTVYYLFTGVWQLYYVFVLIQLLLLHFLIESHFRERINLFLGLSACVSFLFYLFAEYMLWTKGVASDFVENHLDKTPLPWLIFFAFGVWLRSNMWFVVWLVRRRWWLILTTAAAQALYCWELERVDNWLGYNPLLQFPLGGLPYRILAPLLLLIIPFRIGNLPSKWVQFPYKSLVSTSKYTYAIFLSHTAFVIILSKIFWISRNPLGYWIEPPILFMAVWLSCLALLRVIGKLRVHWVGRLLYGSIPKHRKFTGEVS